MTKAKQIAKENDVLDFSKKGGVPFGHLGKCVLVEIKHGRVQAKYTVTALEGERKGRSCVITLRYGVHGELTDYCTVVGENKEVAVAKREEKRELQNKRFQAAAKASEEYEAGDIVRVQSSKSDWNMKVLEVDYKKGRIYGVNAASWNPSSKRAWASLTHPEVKLTLVQKKAFDPRTDSAVIAQQDRAAAVGAKRATTRARRQELRNFFDRF